MGDLAVGARSGHGEPEKRPEGPGGAEGSGGTPGGEAPEAALSQAPVAAQASGDAVEGPDGPKDTGSGGVTPDEDGEGPGATRPKKQRSFWKELPILVGIALVLALIIKTFLVQAFSIPSDSMQDTLQRGDRVLVDKLTPWFGAKPERGEVVVFHDPGKGSQSWLGPETQPQETGPLGSGVQKVLSFIGLMPSAEERDLIKRVIAVGGDTVECQGAGGPVKVNGKALDEKSYIFPGNSPCDDKPFGPIKVPKDHIWVMGDHRQDSLDSRYHPTLYEGTVPVSDVVGRAIVVAWPVNRWSFLPVPGTFDQPGLNAAAAAVPPALGLAGAVPLVLWRRRRLLGRTTSVAAVKSAADRTSSKG
ncbi:signal peptidase I [Streptomyces albireticuli]|uniref:signal peptidase I n=1 Tax=Streptomyces albireticuli TaxID=1940 RepID=UPI003AF05420